MEGTERTGPAEDLADGRGVAPLTLRKLVKDFVADFLLTVGAVVPVVPVAIFLGMPTIDAGYYIIAASFARALAGAGYRAALRWLTTP